MIYHVKWAKQCGNLAEAGRSLIYACGRIIQNSVSAPGNHSCDKQTRTPWILSYPPLLLAVLVSQGEGQGSLRVFPDIHGGKVHGADVEVGDASCNTWTGAIRNSLDIGKGIVLGINDKILKDYMVYLTMMGSLLDMVEMPTQSE